MNNTQLSRNQISSYERLLYVTNSSGLINLNPILNSSYLIVPNNNISIDIINIDDQYPLLNISNNCLLRIFFIILPLTDITLTFNSNIAFPNSLNPNSINLIHTLQYQYTLFSFNSGVVWNIIPLGSFGSYENITITQKKIYNSLTDEVYFNILQKITL